MFVLTRERDHPLEKIELNALRSRIGRKSEHHHFRFGIAAADGPFELAEEIDVRREGTERMSAPAITAP